MASILSECCWGLSPGREEPGAQGGLWSVERPRLDQSRRLDQSPRLSRLWPWEATPSLQLQLSHLSRGKGKAPPPGPCWGSNELGAPGFWQDGLVDSG